MTPIRLKKLQEGYNLMLPVLYCCNIFLIETCMGVSMRIELNDIKEASKAGIISAEQGNRLWHFWQQEQEQVASFRFSHVLYYLGGLLAISAISIFVTQSWEQLRGIPLFVISTLLFILGLLLAKNFTQKKLLIPAGIVVTFSLAVIPLAFYNVQYFLGYLPPSRFDYADYNYFVSWYWVPMELATLLAGILMLYVYRFPFLLFLISITLWYMSMDLSALLFHIDTFPSRAIFTMYFGLGIILLAIYTDLKHSDSRHDYAFWLYIFGVITFWGGLSCQSSDSELSKFFYFLINLSLVFVGVFLNRRVFAVFGALGILAYLGHLSFLFTNNLSFPILLVFLGLMIIFAATRWPRVEKKLIILFKPYIPQKILDRMHNKD